MLVAAPTLKGLEAMLASTMVLQLVSPLLQVP
jgi:hypothetical protein